MTIESEEFIKLMRNFRYAGDGMRFAERIEVGMETYQAVIAYIDAKLAIDAQTVRADALEEAAVLCDVEGVEWDSEAQVTEKNYAGSCGERIRALKSLLAQSVAGNEAGETPTELAHRRATELAVSMSKKFFPEVGQWEPLPDLLGVISQIDNMTCGLVRAPTTLEAPQDHKLEVLQQQAMGWEAVICLLKQIDPAWYYKGATGIDSALNVIRDLERRAAIQSQPAKSYPVDADWRKHVIDAYVTLRTHNSSIPDDVLSHIKSVLVDAGQPQPAPPLSNGWDKKVCRNCIGTGIEHGVYGSMKCGFCSDSKPVENASQQPASKPQLSDEEILAHFAKHEFWVENMHPAHRQGFYAAVLSILQSAHPVNAQDKVDQALKRLPSICWWHRDGYPVFNNLNGDDLILRKDAIAAIAHALTEYWERNKP